MQIQNVDSIMLWSSDVARSVAWYHDVLGLEPRFQHGDFAVLGAGNLTLSLHGGEGVEAGPEGRRFGATPVLGVADYAAAKAELETRGVAFSFENRTPNAVFGSFTDPDGNALQIIQRLA
ncbi:MAG: VOC family protein [Caldilineae bacterium]|nr:VOC family protein [Chloroflexota bacterium]MCB9175897.1 VOC family protein [Caldilineae bacterium]